MHRMPVLLVLAGLGLAAAGCGSGTPAGPTQTPLTPSSQPPTVVQLIGYVDDTTFRPLSNADVEVLDGPQAGHSTTTDATGRFSLTGQFSEATRFRATKAGYQAATETFQQTQAVFFLSVGGPSGNSASLTVEADPACTDLPSEARQRTYAATVTADSSPASPNTAFFATLTGPTLDAYFHRVLIEVAGGVVTFDLSDNGIEEEISEEAYLFVGGVASILPPAGTTTVSAPLTSGLIDYCLLKADPGAGYPCTDQAITRVQCRSAINRLTLTWR